MAVRSCRADHSLVLGKNIFRDICDSPNVKTVRVQLGVFNRGDRYRAEQ